MIVVLGAIGQNWDQGSDGRLRILQSLGQAEHTGLLPAGALD